MPSLLQDTAVVPPFTSAQISNIAFQEECKNMFASATGNVKSVIELGQSIPVNGERNWVIQWAFWHVRHHSRSDSNQSGGMEAHQIEADAGEATHSKHEISRVSRIEDNDGSGLQSECMRTYWDPVRDL